MSTESSIVFSCLWAVFKQNILAVVLSAVCTASEVYPGSLCLQYAAWVLTLSPFTAVLSPVLSFPYFLWAIWQYELFWVQSICTRGSFCLKINLGIFIYLYFKVPINKIDSDGIRPSTKNLIKKCFVLIQGRKSVLQCDWSHQLLCDRI